MEDSAADEFTRHHLVLTELLERLPSVRDDADAYEFACRELARHVAKLQDLGPSGPLSGGPGPSGPLSGGPGPSGPLSGGPGPSR